MPAGLHRSRAGRHRNRAGRHRSRAGLARTRSTGERAALLGASEQNVLVGQDEALAVLEGQQRDRPGGLCKHGELLLRGRARAVALQMQTPCVQSVTLH